MTVSHKSRLVALAFVVFLFGVSNRSLAAQKGIVPDHIVFPTGMWPTDVESVQAALNGGGTVLLKAADAAGNPAAFDFGPSNETGGFVSVTADVTVLGEDVDGHMTTIRGGFLPFRSLAPVKTALRGIRFHQSGFVAINVGATAGMEIIGNVLTDVVAEADFGEAFAIFISNLRNPDRIGGTVTISGNVIAVDPAGGATFPSGIVILGASADLTISGNRVTDARSDGIGFFRTRHVTVVDNVVKPGLGDPGLVSGNGISVTSPLAGHSVLIRDNTVVCDNPNADGIVIGGLSAPISDAVIEKNDVTMHSSDFGGISLYGSVGNTEVRNNKVQGDGGFALQVSQGFDPADQATSNRFLGNNLSHFISAVADIFFDINATDNVLVGHCASAVDRGTNNRYTCRAGTPGD